MPVLTRALEPGTLIVKFWVPGEPVAQPRRWQVTNKKTGECHSIEAPTRHKILPWKDLIRHLSSQSMAGQPPVDCCLRLEMLFLMPRPGKIRNKLLDVDLPHGLRPDGDNMMKALMDAVKMIVWTDDTRVSTWWGRKRYVKGNESPGVLVKIFVDQIPWKK